MKGTKESVGSPKGATKSRTQTVVRAAAKGRAKPAGISASRAEAGHSGASSGSRKATASTKGGSHK